MGSKRKRLTFLVPAMYVCGLFLMGVNLIPAMRRKSSGQNAHNAGGGGGELGRGIDHLASAAAKQPVSLAIAINTLPRSGGANYLLRALRSIEAQRKPLGRTAVYVMNVQPGEHSVFDEARREFDQLEYHFVERAHIREANSSFVKEPKNANRGFIPGHVARQQTRDVAMLTRWVNGEVSSRAGGRVPHLLYMEDDFVLCDGALGKLLGLLAPGVLSSDWTAIRASFGMNMIAMQTKDLSAFAAYIVKKQAHRPVDILVYYWMARESTQRQQEALDHFGRERSNLVYRTNLADHIGRVSTYPGRQVRHFLGCGETLIVWSLHKHERFEPLGCGKYAVSPCGPGGERVTELDARKALLGKAGEQAALDLEELVERNEAGERRHMLRLKADDAVHAEGISDGVTGGAAQGAEPPTWHRNYLSMPDMSTARTLHRQIFFEADVMHWLLLLPIGLGGLYLSDRMRDCLRARRLARKKAREKSS